MHSNDSTIEDRIRDALLPTQIPEVALRRLARLVTSEVANEREACAEVAESLSDAVNLTEQDPGCYIATAIRARGIK